MLIDLPSKKDISTTMSARNTISGRTDLDYNTMSLKMEAYIQLFEGTKNTQHSRLVGVVAINTSNVKGG